MLLGAEDRSILVVVEDRELGPHHKTMGNAQFRHVLTDVRSDCGHCSTGPSGVVDQSSWRMRCAISLLPGKIPSSSDTSASS
jgi:hypothetical protein